MRPGRTYRQRPAGLHSKSNSSRKIIFLLLICVFAASCLIWLRLGGPGIPCLFHLVTGLECPGCGGTRMILAVSRMDFGAAMRANPFLFLTFPCPALLLADSAYRWVKNEKFSRKAGACAALYCVGLVLFGIFRNLV